MLGVMADPPKLIPCTVQIPLVDNDGQEVDPAKLVQIKSWFERQFGGYTILGIMEGSWHGLVEPSMRVEVAIPPDRMGQFRQVVIAIGVLLEQEAMYFNAPSPSAEIISMGEYVKPGETQGQLFDEDNSNVEGGAS